IAEEARICFERSTVEGDSAGSGATASERYRVLQVVGMGASGVVYAAHDSQLDRRIALKLLRPADAGDEGERLLREARLMAQFSHPNVVHVHDMGMLGDQVFLAMEFVDGETLATWQRGRSVREVIGAYRQAGRALAEAHRRGVVHRDFKPENVLVGRDGIVRVTDFGLARSV